MAVLHELLMYLHEYVPCFLSKHSGMAVYVLQTSSTTASLRQHLSSVESFIASMPQPGACDKLVDESTLQQTVASIRATLDRKVLQYLHSIS